MTVLYVTQPEAILSKNYEAFTLSLKQSDDGRKRFLQAFERKMNDEFQHPVFGYRCTYRRSIELQARLLGRFLQDGVPYKPLVLR